MKKKKLIFFSFLFIILIILLNLIENTFLKYNDTIMIQFNQNLTQTDLEYIKSKNFNYLKSINIYNRIKNTTIEYYDRKVTNITVYETYGNYENMTNIKMLKGRFIWDTDIDQIKNYIVIDSILAQRLFASLDCIGKNIVLNNMEFIVCGVYKKNTSYISKLSSVDDTIVYLPFGLLSGDNINQYLNVSYSPHFAIASFKVKNGTAQMVINSIKNSFASYGGGINSIEDVDINIHTGIQKIKLLYFVMFLIFLYLNYKIILYVIRIIKNNIQYGMKQYYFFEYILKVKKQYLLYLIFFILYIFIILYSIKFLSFNIAINPQLIPSSLINIKEIVQKFDTYFINSNNNKWVTCFLHFYIYYINNVLNYICIFTFFIYIKIIKEVKILLKARKESTLL